MNTVEDPIQNNADKKKKNYYVDNKNTLLLADNAIENLTAQPLIKERMAEQGYGEEKVNNLKTIRDNARDKYQATQREGQEDIAARKTFEQDAETLFAMYGDDRKKAKTEFAGETPLLKTLQIDGRVPTSFAARIDTVKLFYRTLGENPQMLERMTTLKVDAARLKTVQEHIAKTEKARTHYLREKGESQDATELKNQAFKELDRELNKMFTLARIALKDNPQLLEALGKTVKS